MKIHKAFIGLFLISSTVFAQAELVVVTNINSSANSIPLSQLSRIFLGQSSAYPDGSSAIPLDINGETRNQFYRDVLKKSPEQVEKYWARMIFTGKAQPPREVKSADVKSVVAETPGAISYMDSSKVDASLKILKVDASR
ncbi:MAG: hypothetical protein ACRERR_03055 [Moraxellaceae bacterium]